MPRNGNDASMADSMDSPLEPIKLQQFADCDRARVQDEAVASATGRTEMHLQRYREDPRSFGGRYVAADLFKETFDQFSASRDARNSYNTPVHNAAAVLSSEQLRRLIAEPDLTRDRVVFLTGIPGAGKTSSVLGGHDAKRAFPGSFRAIFEGQLVRPETTIPKLEQVVAAGLRPAIYVVHVTPELAMQRTLKRFREEGRGASIQTMATVQGGLPDGLQAVREGFGDKVELRVFDNRNPGQTKQHQGWDNVVLLSTEGHRDQVEQRLRAELERIRSGGELSDAAYRQALGHAPASLGRRLGAGDGGRDEPHVGRRGLSPEDRATAFLTLSRGEALRLDPQLLSAFNVMRAAELHADSAMSDPATRAGFLQKAREHLADQLRQGKDVAGSVLKPPDTGISR